MTVRFKRIHPDAALPAYARPGDAGMDLRSVDELVIPRGGRALVHTGLVMELPLALNDEVPTSASPDID